jgi:Ca-activated chloride channel homolog
MSPRARRVSWGVFLALLTAALVWAFRRWVLLAPEGTFRFLREGKQYELLDPRTLGVALVLPLLLFVLGRSLADLPWQQRVLAVVLRLAFIVSIGLGLGRLVRTAESQKVATVVLVDVSDSVPNEALDDARRAFADIAAAKGKDDVVRLVTFAQRARLVELKEQDGAPMVPEAAALRHAPDPAVKNDKPGAGSDLSSALRLAIGVIPPGFLKHAVLLSDGVETDGDVLAEAGRARGFGVKLWTIPYRRPPPGEVAVKVLRAPPKVTIGEPFELTAEIYASRAGKARARLYQGETLNGLDGVREIELQAGENSIGFKSVVRVGGQVSYALKLDQLTSDRFPENNGYAITLDVPGRPAVLYVEGQPQRASYLTSALSAQQFDVDVRAPSAFPGSLKELERYDFFILSDVPAEAVSLGSQDLVEKYVRELGGGFLFAGGENGYGLGGWGHTTIERLLPVRMDAERRKDMPSVAMALVIDRSGSMSGLPLEMAKAACKATVSTLEGDDLVSVIAFDSEPTRYVKFQPARHRARIQNDILRIEPGGGTEIFGALDAAYQDISAVQARKKHVILLTDGRAPQQGIKDLAQAMISEGITITTVGLGDGSDGDLLRMIADTGGGRYHAVPDPNSLPKIFTRETELISRQAAVEEWFPVQQVGRADYLEGISIAGAPLLHGYVATELKPEPARLILASDRDEPILAEWRVGLGMALAWTSDVKNLWAVDWLRWPQFGRFWGQLVRENMRKKHRKELDMKTEVEGNRVRATVDAFTVDERFDNGLVSKLVVTGPQPSNQKREIELRQVAPGRYEADFELEQYGSFLLNATHQRKGEDGAFKAAGVSYGHVTYPYPREYASFEPDVERLTRAASAGGGVVDPTPKDVFAPGDEKLVYQEPLWGRFLYAALVVFVLDLLVRRVRFFDRKFLPKRRARS